MANRVNKPRRMIGISFTFCPVRYQLISKIIYPPSCSTENPCSQKCTDTGLAVECSCNSGYQLTADERTCLDVDECAIGADNCDLLLEICINQPGSFSCMPRPNGPQGPATANPPAGDTRCPRGFKFNAESRVCDGNLTFRHLKNCF